MTGPRIGSLFSGYGGLDMGVQAVFGGTIAWVSDIEPGPSRILAHHHPDVPNLGDVTAVNWRDVEPVDIICGGSPCQDLSHAGRRAGMRDGTRSGLWASMCEAIETIRPAHVIWENVLGALSASAASDMGPCKFGMGCEGPVPLRALGRVLGDLAEVGYDAAWTTLAAADIGAPHRRDRVFVLAWPATDTEHDGRHGTTLRRSISEGQTVGRVQQPQRSPSDPGLELFATPQSRDWKGVPGAGFNTANLARDVSLLPTPAVNDMGASYTPETWDAWTAKMQAKHGNGNGHGKSLSIEAQRLLPTPRATDGTNGGPNQRGSSGDLMLPSAVQGLGWGPPCPTCGCGIDYHDGDGFCAGPCGGNAHDCGGRDLLLPTPRTHNNENRQSEGYGGKDGNFYGLITGQSSWGDYAPAIARWEHVLGRPAPEPTQPSARTGRPQLSPRFVEWMMGLPDGHVTDVPDLSRNAQLKALGNGVVPQQAEAALRQMLAHIDQEVAA